MQVSIPYADVCILLYYVFVCNTNTDFICQKRQNQWQLLPSMTFWQGAQKHQAMTSELCHINFSIVSSKKALSVINPCDEKKRPKSRREWNECIWRRLKRCQVLRAVSVETMVASKSLEVRSHDFLRHYKVMHQSHPPHGSCTIFFAGDTIDKFVQKRFKKDILKWFIEVGRTQRSYKPDF